MWAESDITPATRMRGKTNAENLRYEVVSEKPVVLIHIQTLKGAM